MRIVFTCGGTGGHITPALAIADTVKENCPTAEILFVGANGGMETRLVSNAGYRIVTLNVSGLRRSFSPGNLKVLWRAWRATGEAKKLLSAFCPDLVIGTGGYASFPTLFAATRLGIPAAAHESNAVPGLAISRLAKRLDRVWVNFPVTAEKLPGANCLAVGNPLPRGFGTATPAPLPQGCRLMVLSFGGSLGARELNRAALALMEAERDRPEVYHLHATGKGEYEEWHRVFEERGLSESKNLQLVPYLEDMPRRMAAADVVICRAGAMSISELAAAGKNAVLIPSPNVTGNHQYLNAKVLFDAGAAVLLPETELSEKLMPTVFALLNDPQKRWEMGKKIGQFYRGESNRLIFLDLLSLTKKTKKRKK